MTTDPRTLSERVSSSYSKLALVAKDLNAVSDELGQSVAQIDLSLKNLNLGITVWVKIRDWDYGESGDYEHWSEHLGYAKLSGKWGIGLKRVEGNHNHPEHDSIEEWPFNEAPRALRLEAIEKIPELLEQLSAQATAAAKNIREKLADVKAVVGAVNTPKSMSNVPVKKGSNAKIMSDVPQPHGIAKAMMEAEQPAAGFGRAFADIQRSAIEIPHALRDVQKGLEITTKRAQEIVGATSLSPFAKVPEVKK
jgi:hypothetical protein